MQNESQIEALIVRYLANETTTEEDEAVLSWINESAANRAYFEQAQTAWILISAKEKIASTDTAGEWHVLQAKITDAAIKEKPLQQADEAPWIANEINERRRSSLYKIIKVTVAAASIAGVIALGYMWQTDQPPKAIVHQQNAPRDTVANIIRHEENMTGRTKQVSLPDGSTVLLAHNSTIEFHEPFETGQRTIMLEGKAEFSVVKDSSKPFVVMSDQLQTRVIGTRFNVTSFKESNNITVQLFEGKVVVEPIANMKLNRSYVLAPGEQLIYKKGSTAALVQQMRSGKHAPAANENVLPADEPTLPVAGKGSWYMFNNQSLPKVFDRLELLFDTKIIYKNSEVASLYFIGTFKQTDSLEYILKSIAEINELKVTKKENSYIIGK